MSEIRPWKVSFYSDMETRDEVDSINLGEVWDGESVERVVYMRNDEPHFARDISFSVADPAVSVDGPETLLPGAVAPLRLRWASEPGAELSLRRDVEVRAVLLLRAP